MGSDLDYRIHLERKEFAIEDYNKALEINQRYAEAYYNRGALHCYKGLYDRAIKDFNKALEINPTLAVAYYGRAGSYYYYSDKCSC